MQNKFFFIFIISIFWSCKKDDVIQKGSSTLLNYPSYFGEPTLNPEKNPITEKGIELGKKLFFDPVLSGNNKISCATCHLPELAFTDGVAQSIRGLNGEKLIRNSPTITNLAWHDNYFWDGGAKDLESQVIGPLIAENEMGQDLSTLAYELNQEPDYKELFEEVFNDKITLNYIIRAIAQYERSLISHTSKYDNFLKGSTELTTIEQKGYQLFITNCSGCHTIEHTSDFDFHNNGLDFEFPYEGEDQRLGRYRVTRNSDDLGKYKTPILRNIELTAPYMHDGRFKKLEDVINHYSENIQVSPTLDRLIPKEGFQFTSEEKKNLLTFLLTLTDEKFIKKHK